MTLRSRGPTVLDVTDYGAKIGVDSTHAFQCTIDALPKRGGTVYVPPGRFLIDAMQSVRLRSNMLLHMSVGTVLEQITNNVPRSNVLLGENIEQVEVRGGRIIGDRLTHVFENPNSTDEWGHGIKFTKCDGVTVSDVMSERCTGDGMSVNGNDYCIDKFTSFHNRRQGLTIGGSTYVRVYRSRMSFTGDFENSKGTKPLAGIDIEPDVDDVDGVYIEDVILEGNQGSGLTSYTNTSRPIVPTIKNVFLTRVHAVANGANGIELIRVANANVSACTLERNHWNGLYYGPGSSGEAENNTFISNRMKNGPTVREPKDIEGQTKETGRDIEVRNADDTRIGVNTYR